MLNYINISKRFLSLLFFLISFSFYSLANDHEEAEATSKEGFNAGETIMEHIADSHFWHLWGDHKDAVSIPLPIIVYTDKGIDIFSSSSYLLKHAIYYCVQFTKADKF